MKNIFLLIILSSSLAFSQPADTLKTTMLTPQQMKEDFSQYRKMLEETHPGLYRYNTKEEIQNTLDSVASTLESSKSFYTFYTDLALINSHIKCAHSYVAPAQEVKKYVLNQIKTVPFYFHSIDDKLYVLFNGSLNEDIKPGFELTQINGKSISEIRDIIYKYAWSDGDIESAKVLNMTGVYFWMMYYQFVDQSDQFTMKFNDLDGKNNEVQLAAQAPRKTMSMFKKNPVNKRVWKHYGKKICWERFL